MARKYRQTYLTGWSIMWIFCMFDLPVRTKTEMRAATRFRHILLDNGFTMKQFSVYIRSRPTLDSAKSLTRQLKSFIPENGEVSFIYVTDKQFTMADNFLGKKSKENEEKARQKMGQLSLF